MFSVLFVRQENDHEMLTLTRPINDREKHTGAIYQALCYSLELSVYIVGTCETDMNLS